MSKQTCHQILISIIKKSYLSSQLID